MMKRTFGRCAAKSEGLRAKRQKCSVTSKEARRCLMGERTSAFRDHFGIEQAASMDFRSSFEFVWWVKVRIVSYIK
jgi:hypothetical protein